jgi:hypothetical protein
MKLCIHCDIFTVSAEGGGFFLLCTGTSLAGVGNDKGYAPSSFILQVHAKDEQSIY